MQRCDLDPIQRDCLTADRPQDFHAVGALDPSLPTAAQSSAILESLAELHHFACHFAGLKSKQLSALLGLLAKDVTRALVPSGFRVCKLEELSRGPNVRCALVCRPVAVVASPAGAAAM